MSKEGTSILHFTIETVLYCIAASILAFLISLLISAIYNVNKYNVMTGIGLITIFVGGCHLSNGGTNPISGISNVGQSSNSAAYRTYTNVQVNGKERQINNFFSSANKSALLTYKKSGVIAILAGIVVFAVSVLLESIF